MATVGGCGGAIAVTTFSHAARLFVANAERLYMRSVYDLAYEVLDDCGIRKCAICGGDGIELHHVQHNRKANRAALGQALQVLGVNLIPLCKACHAQAPTRDVLDSTVDTYMRNNLWRAAMVFMERAANQAIDWRLK